MEIKKKDCTLASYFLFLTYFFLKKINFIIYSLNQKERKKKFVENYYP